MTDPNFTTPVDQSTGPEGLPSNPFIQDCVTKGELLFPDKIEPDTRNPLLGVAFLPPVNDPCHAGDGCKSSLQVRAGGAR